MPLPYFDTATFDNYCFDVSCTGADVPTKLEVTDSEYYKSTVVSSEWNKSAITSTE